MKKKNKRSCFRKVDIKYNNRRNELLKYIPEHPKLIQFLTDTLVSNDSNLEIKREALKKYPADSVAQAARKYLKEYNFCYDIDDFIDKRLPV